MNLDRLATRSYDNSFYGRELVEFSGMQINGLIHVLRGSRPFVANLHGISEDANSWVFEYSQIRGLMGNDSYKHFVTTCFSTSSVLFVGISVDDISVGGHLQELSKLGIDTGPHFWLTNRIDIELDRWAENLGIRIIHYRNRSGDHSEVNEFFSDLLSYIPQEASVPPPIVPVKSYHREDLPPVNELARRTPDEIRRILNARAQELIGSGKDSNYTEYEKFRSQYHRAIYNAWYVSENSDDNRLLGYTLQSAVKEGAFGKVYYGVSPSGEPCAVKVLHNSVSDEIELLRSFRRGVRTMRILSSHDVKGMVPYIDACEIPAVAVMRWIDGPDLETAVLSGYFDTWSDRLRLIDELVSIIRNAHQLPERVLHRDLRPSNIMVEGIYSDPYDWDVVVLDFDLSWHKGSTDRSVVFGSTVFNYLAPEQLQDIKNVSTRHAAVDSFGLGMTLYFLLSKTNPKPNHHIEPDWFNQLVQISNRVSCSGWQSLPNRFARLIFDSTQDRQSRRLDMTQIQFEVQRLRDALLNPESVDSADMVAEEIASRSSLLQNYKWDGDKGRAYSIYPSGLTVELVGVEAERIVKLHSKFEDKGHTASRKRKRLIEQSITNARSILESNNWDDCDISTFQQTINMVAIMPVEIAVKKLALIAKTVDDAVQQMRRPFD